MIGLLVLAAAHIVATPAIPRYDVASQCAARSRGLDSANPDRRAISPTARNLCIQREQEAYNELKVIWPRYDRDIRARCRHVGDAARNYQVLLNCIATMDPVQSSRRSSPFHY